MPETKPPSALSAIANHRCPRCRTGTTFLYGPYDLKARFLVMHKHCPHCGQEFEIEPGFFWGAMYISYAFTTGWFLVGLVIYFAYWPPVWVFIGIYLAFVLLTVPINNRYARTLLLHIFSPIKFSREAWLKGRAQ